MPVRIYSLAKELKLDSKILVDICTSAGVTGKGSALASLTDEEADRVKAYLSGAGPSAKAPAAKPPKSRKSAPKAAVDAEPAEATAADEAADATGPAGDDAPSAEPETTEPPADLNA